MTEKVKEAPKPRFICRGKLIREEKQQRRYFDAWYAAEREGDKEYALKLIDMLEGERRKIALKLAPGYFPPPLLARPMGEDDEDPRLELSWAQLRRKAFPLIRLRTSLLGRPCGHDLTEQLAEVEADGQEHQYECPKCGNTGTFKPIPDYENQTGSPVDDGADEED